MTIKTTIINSGYGLDSDAFGGGPLGPYIRLLAFSVHGVISASSRICTGFRLRVLAT